jgi:uncharacterized protein YwgA
MAINPNRQLKLAVIAALASKLNESLGRTALMKLIFFLQARRGIDLGYSFRLYNYGPYDSQVIGDLKIAESLGIVVSKEFSWSGGSGYTIGLGSNALALLEKSKKELLEIETSIDWVVAEFGRRSAADLEIASTIVFADDACLEENRSQSIGDLVSAVHSIKPHHSEERISVEVSALQKNSLLNSITEVAQ